MAWIAGVAGMASSAAGAEALASSTVEGAQAQNEIESRNRGYQRKIFDENIDQQSPYYEAGLNAMPMLEQFRSQGGVDLSGNPLYQMEQRAGQEGLDMAGGVRQGGRDYFQNALNASSQQPAYNRLLDLQQVGMGSAGSAGQGAATMGSALSDSFQTGANAMMQGTANAGNQRQSLYSNAAGQAGAMPAYYNYLSRTGGN
jgi:hypothetical protein